MTIAGLRKVIDQAVAWQPDSTPQTSHDATFSPPFVRVPVADVMSAPPQAPTYWWDLLLPAGHVTVLGAHGGTGKSMIALMLACALAAELPLFGIPTRRAKVAYFSAEDPASVTRHRLHMICRAMSLDPALLAPRLHILDATAGDPVLFHEVSAGGTRSGATTGSYEALAGYLDEHAIDVLIVDNASDAFDANENDRSRVRGFMRALAVLAKPDRAVFLLVHVDKGTSRGDRGGTEGYSGSTAWHNSARSRLYLSRDRDGTLLLEHQKNNHGRLRDPMRLIWLDGGLPQVDAPMEPTVQRIADGNNTKVILKLLAQFYSRGEFVATDTRSRYHAVKVLGDEPGFPKKLKAPEVFQMLRDAEQRQWIAREGYRDRNRKEHERWALTPSGCDALGIPAPSAPCAPSSDVGALSNTAQQGAPSAPCGVQGVRGNRARADDAQATL